MAEGSDTSPKGLDVAANSTQEQEKLNVIRIKRKRGEEPHDSLLVELPVPKKTLIDTFKDLSTKDTEAVTAEPKIFCLVGTVSSHDTPARLKDKIKEAQQKRKLLLRTNLNQSADDKVLEHKDAKSKQQKEARKHEVKLVRNSTKGPGEFSELFHLVDLVKVPEATPLKPPTVRPTPSSNMTKNNNSNKENTNNINNSSEQIMCNYMPMVREYLSSTTNTTPKKSQTPTKTSNNSPNIHDATAKTKENEESDGEDDYVYDVYYADDSTSKDRPKESVVVARIETFDEELDEDNEYDDGDTDSDDEENRVTDIYPDEDEDPEFEAENGSSSEEYSTSSDDEFYREAGYDRSESDDGDNNYW
eukprot:Phypoly_transcript_12455.p1 GENE.Phypoly_transcript_12455~~Phypoly_transcript_12455.p1  ORF type:complete len:371 (+),score=79.64 Phypoly_transcript_12455:35-1114(+)